MHETFDAARKGAADASTIENKRWAIVGLFLLAYVMSYVDRQLLALLVGPVKASFGLSDTQFGLLNGLAFALFYATLGLPISTLSDRAPRPLVIAGGLGVWSVATVACGLAHSYPELFAARILVGAGEAALLPAVYSFMPDLFPRERLGTAMASFSLGSFLGTGLAFLLGSALVGLAAGLVREVPFGLILAPWQICFCLAGLPGLLLAAVIGATVKEVPQRRTRGVPPRLAQVAAMLSARRAIFGPHLLGYTLIAMGVFALLGWSPALLGRCFLLPPHTIGLVLGSVVASFGSAGIVSSGVLSDRLLARGWRDAPFRVGAIGALGSLLPIALLPFAHSLAALVPLLAVALFFASFALPSSILILQNAAPPQMRSRVSAIFLFCNSLGGLALGSFLIGLLDDRVFPGPHGIAASLALVAGLSTAIGVAILWRGAAAYRRLLATDV